MPIASHGLHYNRYAQHTASDANLLLLHLLFQPFYLLFPSLQPHRKSTQSVYFSCIISSIFLLKSSNLTLHLSQHTIILIILALQGPCLSYQQGLLSQVQFYSQFILHSFNTSLISDQTPSEPYRASRQQFSSLSIKCPNPHIPNPHLHNLHLHLHNNYLHHPQVHQVCFLSIFIGPLFWLLILLKCLHFLFKTSLFHQGCQYFYSSQKLHLHWFCFWFHFSFINLCLCLVALRKSHLQAIHRHLPRRQNSRLHLHPLNPLLRPRHPCHHQLYRQVFQVQIYMNQRWLSFGFLNSNISYISIFNPISNHLDRIQRIKPRQFYNSHNLLVTLHLILSFALLLFRIFSLPLLTMFFRFSHITPSALDLQPTCIITLGSINLPHIQTHLPLTFTLSINRLHLIH